jgi:hypothetical protein
MQTEAQIRAKKKYRENNREKCREANQRWLESNREKHAETSAAWQKANPEKCREKGKRYRKNLRIEVVVALGGKCVRCGIADWRVLQIDHVQGGGRKELETFESRAAYYRHVLKSLDTGDYQILCSNCNWVKRYEMREDGRVCPPQST